MYFNYWLWWRIYRWIENKYYQMVKLKNRDSVMKKESEITDSKKKKRTS